MRKYVLAIIGLVLLCLVAALGTASGSASTFTVNTTDDTDDLTCDTSHCSLREAINAANSSPGSTIEFNIPLTDTGYQVSGITGTWTISLTSSLPTLTGGGTIISGTTQPEGNPHGPEIEISGADMGSGACLRIESAGNVIHGLVINRCPDDGITIVGASATTNTVSGNYIGTDASGSSDLVGNGTIGVEIREGAQGNVVGGDTPEERNVISKNGQYGVSINGSMSNTVSANYIGTDVTGALPGLGNGLDGVIIYGGAQHNTVGGDTEEERNIISDNGMDGVRIEGSSTTSNTISGNFIGTVVSGTQGLGNTNDGVRISAGARNNTVGGATEGKRNVIAANRMGVNIVGSDTMSNTVSGNYIGTDASGSSDLGNVYNGVEIGSNAQNNTVGGQTALEGNVISGNGRTGVHIGGAGTDGNTVSLNYIGTDETGTQALGNGWDGISIEDGPQNNTIGPDNLIALNSSDGVEVRGTGTLTNTITRNSIHSNVLLGIENVNGGNAELTPPAISVASCAAITGTALPSATVEIFTGPDQEGKTYLATASADGAGQWSVVGPFTIDVYVSATATDGSGNTSEFSAEVGTCHQSFLPLTVKNY
ncbi:MAG: CSLREA domain-containing protein [Anaerolineae bacterium]|nr:CSLREA domain-containing protein [Anaerolineae bacterium]NIN95233.1 CSLREA domain-containing protein [Anaerolineae bacterium]NIQ78196.1 CSLREA domain-containing protein [Anaerolineae bacterium]